MTPTYLLLYNIGGLVVEDGPQAMGVRGSFWVQAEVQGHKNGGEFIPEFFLILQVKKTHGRVYINTRSVGMKKICSRLGLLFSSFL